MTKSSMNGAIFALSLLLILAAFACGKSSRQASGPAPGGPAPVASDGVMPFDGDAASPSGWPNALPADRPQPWEKLDENGYVIPAGGARSESSLNPDSEFAAGAERYSESGDVTDFGEASRFASGVEGARGVSYALYRLPMGAGQPGAIAADVNPTRLNEDTPSDYFTAISDYGNGTWKWYGPFKDSHVRISIPQGDFTSPIGDTFIAFVAFDGGGFDVVGVGANPKDDADSTAPPVPGTPTLTPASGGVVVEWPDVVATDLAGYRIYYSDATFDLPGDTSTHEVGYLAAQPRFFIPRIGQEVIVTRISAVDISGNESALSPEATATPLAGTAIGATLQTDTVSAKRGATIALTATGGESYDFDIDGDGFFDETNSTGATFADTSNTGIIRPAVRCTNSGGGISFAAVSLIITSNSRPVASAQVNPSEGAAPLDVFFNGEGADDDGTIAEYAWDFEGDGAFDYTDASNPEPPVHQYTDPGLYNAKFRVTDDQGSWDVDTVSVLVTADSANNQPPAADLNAGGMIHQAGEQVNFDASMSGDTDGAIVRYEWDFDGDFLWDKTGDNPTASHIYTDYFDGTASVRVTDNGGLSETATIPIRINVQPYMIGIATPSEAENGQTVLLDASGSFDSDGQITFYEWDFNYDGDYEVSTGTTPYYQLADYAVMRYTVGVRVTDDLQGTGEGTISFTVKGWGSLYSVAPTEDSFHSMALVYGKPAMSFYNWNDSDLMFIRNTDDSGFFWTQPVTVDAPGVVGRDSSLAVVNGFPAIAYLDAGNTDLKYCRALDEIGNSWGSPITVDGTGGIGVGEKPCLLVVGGRPAIAYVDLTNANLRYVRANDADGNSWGTPVFADNSGTVGVGSVCMMMVTDRPCISYYNDVTKDLMFVRANGQQGTTWNSPVTVDATEDLGRFNSMAMVDGRPAIAYYNETQNWIQFVRATDFDGATWGSEVPITHSDDIGQYLSLAVIDGIPTIAFYNETFTDLHMVEAYFPDGSSWQNIFMVLGSSDVGKYTNLIEYQGNAAIATFDNTSNQIVFIRRY